MSKLLTALWDLSSEYKWILDEAPSKSEIGNYDGAVIGVVEGPFFGVNAPSKNGWYYTDDLWTKILNDPEVKDALERRVLFGTIGHDEKPVDDDDLRKGNVSHVFTDLYVKEVDGKQVGWGKALILDTEVGRNLKTYLKAGCQLATSVRGAGSLDKTRKIDNCYPIKKDDYVFLSIDFVVHPGVKDVVPNLVEKRGGFMDEKLKELLGVENTAEIPEILDSLRDLVGELGEDNLVDALTKLLDGTEDDEYGESPKSPKAVSEEAEKIAKENGASGKEIDADREYDEEDEQEKVKKMDSEEVDEDFKEFLKDWEEYKKEVAKLAKRKPLHDKDEERRIVRRKYSRRRRRLEDERNVRYPAARFDEDFEEEKPPVDEGEEGGGDFAGFEEGDFDYIPQEIEIEIDGKTYTCALKEAGNEGGEVESLEEPGEGEAKEDAISFDECPDCGYREPHEPGVPASSKTCPKCGSRMKLEGWKNRGCTDALKKELQEYEKLIADMEEQKRLLEDELQEVGLQLVNYKEIGSIEEIKQLQDSYQKMLRDQTITNLSRKYSLPVETVSMIYDRDPENVEKLLKSLDKTNLNDSVSKVVNTDKPECLKDKPIVSKLFSSYIKR